MVSLVKTKHTCDYCGEPAGIQCPDSRCLHWLCDECDEVYMFCQDHTDLPLPDPALTPEINRLRALVELKWRSGPACPECRVGELEAQDQIRYSEALGAIAQVKALQCTQCEFNFQGTTRWSHVGPSAFRRERLRNWKQQIGSLELDVRVSADIFDAVLGNDLAAEFRQTLAKVKDRIDVHIIEEDVDVNKVDQGEDVPIIYGREDLLAA